MVFASPSRRPTHNSSSPRRRGSSTPGSLPSNREAAAYWVARSSRAMTAECAAHDRNQLRRPCERRDPYHVISLVGVMADTFCHHERRWLWVPAFPGTTRGECVHPSHHPPCRGVMISISSPFLSAVSAQR